MTVCLRPATAADQRDITTLVRSERLRPTGLRWSDFTVAVGDDGRVVGAVQLRCHADGSHELGSLVVAGHSRGRGVGSRLVDAVLERMGSPIHMITASQHAAHYRRWGFRLIDPRQAPRLVRLNYRLGRLARILSFFRGQPPKNLVILARPPVPPPPGWEGRPVRVRRRAGVTA